ncbi:MAG: hypothetical protein Q8M16_19785 [Pirellulaceae bacterium]|nr:hypothetical protein [Pirellulaceae bacterium]
MSSKCMGFSLGLFLLLLVGGGIGEVANAQAVSESHLSNNHPLIKQKHARMASVAELLRETSDRIDETRALIEKLRYDAEQLDRELQADNVSDVSYPQILMQLQVQRINLSIEKAGLDAKSERLLQLVGDPATDTPDEKALGKRAKLEELLELERAGLARADQLQKRGVLQSNDLIEARKRVIEIELKLLDLEGPQRPKSPESVWAAELLSKTALDRIEVNAKLATVEKLLGPLQTLRPKLSALEANKNELDSWRDEQAKLKDRQMELKNRLREMKNELNLSLEGSGN